MTENQPANNDPTNDQPTAPQPAAGSADSGTAAAPAAPPTSSASSRRALAIGAGVTAGALVLALGGLAAGAAMASGQEQDRDRDRNGSGPPWQDGEWSGPMGGPMGGMLGRDPGGERGPGPGLGVGLAHGLMMGGPALHGEAVVERDGEYVTITMQRGEATAVSATSITVLSDDGFTRTYTITDDTLVRSPDAEDADAAIDGIESGDDVHVMALADGDRLTARAVMEPGSWHGPWWADQDDEN